MDNLSNFAKEFLKAFTFSDNDRMVIDKATMAQHKNKTCMSWDNFLVMENKIKSIYTWQKTLEKDPHTDISLTIKNFTE